MAAYLPPVGFHFRVEILDLELKDNDIRFTDVGGLSLELATEEKAEGGQNRYVQKFPTRAKYPELTLKRGLLNDTAIFPWVTDCIENFNIQPKKAALSDLLYVLQTRLKTACAKQKRL